jgi:hypothetical protein
MTSTKDKIEEVIDLLQAKINDECQASYTDYCQLALYTRDKKEAHDDDFDDDCYFFIVDRATRATIGTISASEDDNYHIWIMVNGVNPKTKKLPSIQSRLFNENLEKVNELSDKEYTVQDSDISYYITKSNNILKNVQVIEPGNIILMTSMLLSITVSYWVPLIFVGTNLFLLLFPAFNLMIFCAMLFDDNTY